MRIPKSLATPLLILAIVLAGFVILKTLAAQKKSPPKRPVAPLVMTAMGQVVQHSAQVPVVRSQGRLRTIEALDLVPEVTAKVMESGYRLRPGTLFVKGQPVLILEDAQARNTYASAKSDLLTAVAQTLPDLKADWPATASQWDSFVAALMKDSLPDLPDSLPETQVLYLSRQRIPNLLANAKNLLLQVQKHVLVAPFYGTTVSSSVVPGGLARAGTPVAKLARTDLLEAEIPVPAGQILGLKIGERLTVTLRDSKGVAGERTFAARLARIGSVLDERSQSRMVYLEVPASDKALIDGAYVNVSFPAPNLDRAYKVARTALFQDDKMLLVKDGKLRIVPIGIAAMDIDFAYVSGGLEDGDTVLVRAVQDPVEGTPVTVLMAGE